MAQRGLSPFERKANLQSSSASKSTTLVVGAELYLDGYNENRHSRVCPGTRLGDELGLRLER